MSVPSWGIQQLLMQREEEQRRLQQAQQTMYSGFAPGGNNIFGLLAGVASAIAGKKRAGESQGRLDENLKAIFDEQNRAAQAQAAAEQRKRQEQYEDAIRVYSEKAKIDAANRPPDKVGFEERLFGAIPENLRGQAALNKFGLGPREGRQASAADFDLVQTANGLMRVNKLTGQASLVSAGDGAPVVTVKPGGGGNAGIPVTALKLQQAEIDRINAASNINKELEGIRQRIEGGSLDLGPAANLGSRALNAIGMSTESSRNFASMQSTLEKIRNESLRLNAGVQTEGDAQRAWNELVTNINDPELVKQRLTEISQINQRAMDQRMANVDAIRANFGADPYEFQQQTPQTGAGQPPNFRAGTPAAPPAGAAIGSIITAPDGRRYRIIGGDPNDPDVEPAP